MKMTKKRMVVAGLGTVATLVTACAYEMKKKNRIERLEDSVSGLVFTQESMLKYQSKKNKSFDQRLDSLVEEIGCVYEHLEYVNDKEEVKE